MKKAFKYLIIFLILLVVSIIAINAYILSFSPKNTKIANDYKIALVLGASVKGNSKPSDILKDRLDVAIDYYRKGSITDIIVSGDNSKMNYNEPKVMEKYLSEAGVLLEDIHKDYAGFDTYDSIYRAKEIFGIRKLVIFTQNFHVKRAVYISKRLGIETVGIPTDLQPYLGINYFEFREVFSRVKAFFDVEVFHSKPKFLGDKININQ